MEEGQAEMLAWPEGCGIMLGMMETEAQALGGVEAVATVVWAVVRAAVERASARVVERCILMVVWLVRLF